MADIKSPEKRSENMSKIRSKGTAPEEYVRKELFRRGYRYRKNARHVSGCPDVWMAGHHTAVFVHGCFWHRHRNCRYAYTPKSHVDFWLEKFRKNVIRDAWVVEDLNSHGIRVMVIWECTVKAMKKSETRRNDVLELIDAFLAGGEMYIEL